MSKLIDEIIKRQDAAGVLKSAPQALKNLKESLENVPFQLLQPGMSGVMDIMKIMQAVTQLAGQLGGLSKVGNLSSLMGRFQGLATSISGVAKLDTSTLASKVSLDEITTAMGHSASFGAALSQYANVESLQTLNTLAGQPADANLDGVKGGGATTNEGIIVDDTFQQTVVV